MAALSILLAASFTLCTAAPRVTCVVDGDTFWLDGEKVRIADIDTPETHSPACASERARGQAATQRLIALLNEGPFELLRKGRDRDRYGRMLRIAVRGGESLGGRLVAEGLARRWSGKRGGWCPTG